MLTGSLSSFEVVGFIGATLNIGSFLPARLGYGKIGDMRRHWQRIIPCSEDDTVSPQLKRIVFGTNRNRGCIETAVSGEGLD
jgi:hypothetical protein